MAFEGGLIPEYGGVVSAQLVRTRSSIRAGIALAALALAGASCTEVPRGSVGMKFRSHCQQFEVVAFDKKYSARAVAGRTLVETDDGSEPLSGVQVAVKNLATKRVQFTVSGPDGRFSLPRLRPGLYETWTCFDGFDELEFKIRLAPDGPPGELLLLLGPSESGGIRDVRFVPGS